MVANEEDGLECGDKPTGMEEGSVAAMLEKVGFPGLGTGAWLACGLEAIVGSEREEVIPLTLPTLGGFISAGSDLGLGCMKVSICTLAGVAG